MGREGGGGWGARGWSFAGANLGWSYRPRLRQLAKEQGRGAAWPLMLQVGNLSPGLTAVVGAGGVGKASAGVGCDSHTGLSTAAGIDYSRVEGRPGALRTTVKQNLICASGKTCGQ
jgi:hypothetical protein